MNREASDRCDRSLARGAFKLNPVRFQFSIRCKSGLSKNPKGNAREKRESHEKIQTDLRLFKKPVMKPEILHKHESYAIMGACFAVYKEKGCGFTGEIYQECLEIEFDFSKVPFQPQAQLPLQYRGRTWRHLFSPDFICYNKIILEIKAVSELSSEHRSQVLNYLHATGFQLGLLANFGAHPRLEYERLANSSRIQQPKPVDLDEPAEQDDFI